jgi:hypothetical protein
MARYEDADRLRSANLSGGYDAADRLGVHGTDPGGIQWATGRPWPRPRRVLLAENPVRASSWMRR